MDQWEVLITGHHPGYITWEEYLANQERLRANCPAPAGQGGGAVREGRALLQGLLRCGRCGRMMRTGYDRSGTSGIRPRYYCAAEATYLGRKAPCCQSAGGRELEKAVLAQIFATLEPAALAATARALADTGAARAERLKVFELAAERARYEADRARRQYDACEPENRLVARTLEAAWEDKLAAVTASRTALAAEQARQPATLTDDEMRWLAAAGADIQAVFDAPSTTPRERKQLIRALLTEITVTVDQQARTAALTIYREGGESTAITAPLPRLGAPWRTTDTSTVNLVRSLAEHYDDAAIASTLARQELAVVVLDGPVLADEAGQVGRGGVGAGQAGDGVDGLAGGLAGGGVLPPAGDLDGLAGVREVQVADVGGLQGAGLGAAVPGLAGGAPAGTCRQGRALTWACSSGWLRFTIAM